jgi:hypothetical protein
MAAALAILRGGREPQTGHPPSGFHQWDRAVRWPLINAGVTDPVMKFDEVREKSPDYERQTAWMLGLTQVFGVGAEFASADVSRRAGGHTPGIPSLDHVAGLMMASTDENDAFRNILADHPPPKGWDNVKSIGWMLNRLVGRVVEGHTLRRKMVQGKTRYWIEGMGPKNE